MNTKFKVINSKFKLFKFIRDSILHHFIIFLINDPYLKNVVGVLVPKNGINVKKIALLLYLIRLNGKRFKYYHPQKKIYIIKINRLLFLFIIFVENELEL